MNRNLRNIFRLLPSLFFLLIFCTKTNQSEQEPVFSKDKFISLYTESLVLKFSDLPFEKMDSSLIKIYQKYNLTEEKYEQIENYYKKNPKEWLDILAQVDKRIQGFSENTGEKNAGK